MSGFAGKIIFSGDFQSSNSLLIENGLLCRGKEFKKIVNLTEKCAAFNVLNENQLSSEVNLIENEKYIINFDGRIDNKQRLSNELKIDSYATNAEIVLKGYEVWGNELPNHIIGCFCFCIYDKDHKEILCATDHLSMRSLYYLISEDGFFYASEPKFIFMLSGLRKELNENKLRASILRSEQNNNETFFKRVSKLDRGMLLRASDTKNEIIKYF